MEIKQPPSTPSKQASLTDGKDYSLVNLRHDPNWTPQQRLHGLVNNRGWIEDATPADAFTLGLPLSTALRIDRQTTKMHLLSQLVRLQKGVRVADNRTWDQEAARDCVDDICDVFRTMKLEEISYVLQKIRRGQIEIYARLDTPTIMKALQDHDVNVTTTFRDRQQTSDSNKIHADSGLAKAIRDVADTFPREHLTLEQALARGGVLTNKEKDELRKRDAERNQKHADT